MNILYTFNDGFVPQVGAGIASVCENNKSVKKIHFYLVYFDVNSKNKKELEKLIRKYKREVTIIELNSLDEYFDFDFDTNGWNPIVLSRLLLDKILPESLDRVLYLDGDTIVRGSLSELWNIDFNGKTIGMSIEPTIDKNRIKVLNMGNKPYYNAGVLMVDLNRWRKIKAGDKIIKYYKKFDGKLFANDQDAINGAMKDEIIIISPKYNFYNIFNQYSYSFLKKQMCPVEYISKEVFDDAVNDPVIIHYLGEERPWRKGNTHKYRSDYKKYLSITKWKNTADEEGWQLYFFCWSIFNTVTKPFPRLRLKIINGLIPAFMKVRRRKLNKK